MLDQLPKNYFTFRDYQQWEGDERYELIDGEAYAMSPAPSRRHQDVVFDLARQLADALEGGPCRVYLAPFDVRLPRGAEDDAEIDTVVQPAEVLAGEGGGGRDEVSGSILEDDPAAIAAKGDQTTFMH